MFRQAPQSAAPAIVELSDADFSVPSTLFRGVALNAPLRRGSKVLIKSLPGTRVEWAAADPVLHELRHEGQTQWIAWEAELPPEAEVRLRRGSVEIWAGRI